MRLPSNVYLWLPVFLICSMAEVASLYALTDEEQNTIAVYEQVAASVVNITTTTVPQSFFFQALPSSGAGSGIIVDEDGTIVTNHHVIENVQRIEVALADGSRHKAKLVGASPENDLAAIRIDAENLTLEPIALGDSDKLEVGQKLLAIGNPFGLGGTLTTGTVSMLGRSIRNDGRVLRDLIQTDASVNPGNSGGALVNSRGELVGINTAIFSTTGASIGIGFAIPVNRVKKVLPGMIHVWGKWAGWILALVLVFWMLKHIYRS